MTKTIALVLGSGGARGYAHVGVIQELEKRGYHISSITGVSIGALIGGLWAANRLDEYCKWVETIDYFSLFRLLDISWGTPGFIKGDRVFKMIRELLGNTEIEQLKVPFTAVATNLNTRKEVWFQQGDLVTAIRASSAIPSIFSPVSIQGQLLVDGGILNPLPVTPTGSLKADYMLAVDLLGQETKEYFDDSLTKCTIDKKRTLKNWFHLDLFNPDKNQNNELERRKLEKSIGTASIFYQSLEVMQESLARYKIAGHPPDLLISIPKNICHFYDFHKFKEIAYQGRCLASKALDSLEKNNNLK